MWRSEHHQRRRGWEPSIGINEDIGALVPGELPDIEEVAVFGGQELRPLRPPAALVEAIGHEGMQGADRLASNSVDDGRQPVRQIIAHRGERSHLLEQAETGQGRGRQDSALGRAVHGAGTWPAPPPGRTGARRTRPVYQRPSRTHQTVVVGRHHNGRPREGLGQAGEGAPRVGVNDVRLDLLDDLGQQAPEQRVGSRRVKWPARILTQPGSQPLVEQRKPVHGHAGERLDRRGAWNRARHHVHLVTAAGEPLGQQGDEALQAPDRGPVQIGQLDQPHDISSRTGRSPRTAEPSRTSQSSDPGAWSGVPSRPGCLAPLRRLPRLA